MKRPRNCLLAARGTKAPRERAAVFSLLMAFLAFAVCDRGPSLEKVAPPGDGEQLDPLVKSQFETYWGALDGLASRDGAAWGRLGQWFHAYKYPTSAASCYRNASMLEPREARWRYLLGKLSLEDGDLDAAAAHFEAACARDPRAAAPRVELGDLASDLGDLDAAESHYRWVLDRDPEDPAALFGMARVCIARGEPQAALDLLRTVERLQPEATQVLYNLGMVLTRMGNSELGRQYLDRVPMQNLQHVALRRNDPWMREVLKINQGGKELNRRGVHAFRRGDYAGAAVLTGQAVIANPENLELRINYAVTLKKLGRPLAALEQLEWVLALEPENERAHLVLGVLYLEEGRLAAAERHLQKALDLDPRSSEANLQYGKLRQFQGRMAEAADQYALVRKLDPAHSGARFWHAALLIALDKVPRARAVLEDDLKMLPDDRMLRFLRIRLCAVAPRNSGDRSEAENWLSGDSGARDVFYAETAAMVAAAGGEFERASAWQREAVETLVENGFRKPAGVARRRLVLYQAGKPCGRAWERFETLIETPVSGPSTP